MMIEQDRSRSFRRRSGRRLLSHTFTGSTACRGISLEISMFMCFAAVVWEWLFGPYMIVLLFMWWDCFTVICGVAFDLLVAATAAAEYWSPPMQNIHKVKHSLECSWKVWAVWFKAIKETWLRRCIIYICTVIYICMYVCMFVCMYIHIYIYV